MTTIIINRLHSGFCNVADHYSRAGRDHGVSEVGAFALPDGYTVDEDVVRDPCGYECAIVRDHHGLALISRAGSCPDAALRAI